MALPSATTDQHPLTLRFVDPDLEAEYLRDAFGDYGRPLRIAVAVGVFLFVTYAGVDRYLFGRWEAGPLLMRATVALLGFAMIGLSLHRSFARWVRPLMAVLHLAAGLTLIQLSMRHSSYLGGVYATMMFFALLARAQFVYSTLINVGMWAWFAVVHQPGTDTPAALVDITMLFSAVVVIGLGAWVKERSDRRSFVQRREADAARDRALAASRTKSTFLANMSHELRTPLNAVIGYGELVQEDVAEAGLDDCVEDLEKIVTSGKHLLGLINDVLDLAKIEAGKVQVMREEIDVSALARDVAATVAPLVERNDNRFDLSIARDVGTIFSDSTRVRQILFNLLSNAAKFTKKGRIDLRVHREDIDDGSRLVMEVTDTGIGMTADQQEHVFESFRQADASTSRDYGGTGLGLTITKHFAELLGGGIELRSEPGVGTTFTVRLPAA